MRYTGELLDIAQGRYLTDVDEHSLTPYRLANFSSPHLFNVDAEHVYQADFSESGTSAPL